MPFSEKVLLATNIESRCEAWALADGQAHACIVLGAQSCMSSAAIGQDSLPWPGQLVLIYPERWHSQQEAQNLCYGLDRAPQPPFPA